MTASNMVRTARTVRTTAWVSQESWTAGNQCFSASCLDEILYDDHDYNDDEDGGDDNNDGGNRRFSASGQDEE